MDIERMLIEELEQEARRHDVDLDGLYARTCERMARDERESGV